MEKIEPAKTAQPENLSTISDGKRGVLKVRRLMPGKNIPIVMISGHYLRDIGVDIGDYVLVSIMEEGNKKFIKIEKAKVTITTEE